MQAQKAMRKDSPSSFAPLRITPVPSRNLLQRKACACGGGCPRCWDNYPLQAKLEVSQPGDALEQDADRVADQVLRMPQPEAPDFGKVRVQKAASEKPRIYRQPDETDAGELNEAPPYPKAMAATEQEYYERYLRDCAGVSVLRRLERHELSPLEKVARLERRLRRLPDVIKRREAIKEEIKKPQSDDKGTKKDSFNESLRKANSLRAWDKQNIEPEFGQDYALGSLEHELAVAQCELSEAWWEYMVLRRSGKLPGERRLTRK